MTFALVALECRNCNFVKLQVQPLEERHLLSCPDCNFTLKREWIDMGEDKNALEMRLELLEKRLKKVGAT